MGTASPELKESPSNSGWGVIKSLARFMLLDEDNDLVMFRRFKKLSLYILLDKQDRLMQIEDCINHWEDNENSKVEIAEELEGVDRLLKEYHEALLRQRQILRLPKPPKTLIEYLRTQSDDRMNEWVPIIHDKGIDDLISLAECERGFLDRYLRKTPWLEKIFFKSRDPGLPGGLNLYSEGFVKHLETFTIMIAFGVLVLAPIVGLTYLDKVSFKLLVISVAMILTSIVASALSDNSHRGSLAIIAAYTAILVVFLGNSIE